MDGDVNPAGEEGNLQILDERTQPQPVDGHIRVVVATAGDDCPLETTVGTQGFQQVNDLLRLAKGQLAPSCPYANSLRLRSQNKLHPVQSSLMPHHKWFSTKYAAYRTPQFDDH